MTPEEFNELVARLTASLRGAPDIDSISEGEPADEQGTEPTIYVEVAGVPLCLTVSPL